MKIRILISLIAILFTHFSHAEDDQQNAQLFIRVIENISLPELQQRFNINSDLNIGDTLDNDTQGSSTIISTRRADSQVKYLQLWVQNNQTAMIQSSETRKTLQSGGSINAAAAAQNASMAQLQAGQASYAQQTIVTGVEVTPKLTGDSVTLKINPYSGQWTGSDGQRSQNASSVFTVPLNTWVIVTREDTGLPDDFGQSSNDSVTLISTGSAKMKNPPRFTVIQVSKR